MRGLTSTLVLLAVLAGLGGYIYFVDADKPTGEAASGERLFTVEADAIQEITVKSGEDTTVLRKADGAWKIVSPTDADVDEGTVSSLASNLATLDMNRVVDPNATDLAQYGLDAPAVEVSFKGAGATAGRVALGNKTPTGSDIYALTPGERKVFAVSAFVETTFNKKTFDLRDKRALKFDRDKVDTFEVAQGAAKVVLKREGTMWRMVEPAAARVDYGVIEGLLTRLSTLTMAKLVSPTTSDFAPYGLATPVLTAKVSGEGTEATLAIGGEEDGDTYARDAARPMVFTLDPTFVAELKKPAADYRDKDLFEFRPFSAARVRFTRGSETLEFQKVAGEPGAGDTWQRVGGASPTNVDAGKMSDLLTKLSAMQASTFVPTPSSPALTTLGVAVSFDEGKFERVRFGRSGSDALAVREGEPGAMRLDGTPLDDALKALDDLLAPPAATTSTTPPATPPTGR